MGILKEIRTVLFSYVLPYPHVVIGGGKEITEDTVKRDCGVFDLKLKQDRQNIYRLVCRKGTGYPDIRKLILYIIW